VGLAGFELAAIQRLYPYLASAQIEQALELEKQLDNNLTRRAA
jgi:hypothetical protein